MDARSTPARRPGPARRLALRMPAPSRRRSDDRKDPTPLDFAALMRRVEAEVYDIT